MSPLSTSPNNQSSNSNSTTPPSETTLADQLNDIETPQPNTSTHPHQYKVQDETFRTTHSQTIMDPDDEPRPKQQLNQYRKEQIPEAINTDYESSAAEDYDSYTLSKYENAEYALLSYSRTNKVEKLQALLEAKLRNEISLNLNYKGQQKQNFSWSALHLACYFGHIKVMEQILAKKQLRDGIDINIQNISGDTPLHKATLTNRVQIVQLLLANGANVFVKNCDGLLAKQLTNDKHILNMLEAAEQADRNRIRQDMFKAVDNGDLKKLQEYFTNYDTLKELPHAGESEEKPPTIGENNENLNQIRAGPSDCSLPSADYISQMVDERGNTLLHLAAMRGFKAICVYLLEQGFDPYLKNSLGQTCIDLSSYQLRQLFLSVKPADAQLKRLSRERVTRFEGPLLKKVRILGWKQIYVVLENGVILLFNNRRDSINRSRRGYKYLESASCEPDPNDVGMFTICFSDISRATFLVNQDHLNHYTTFMASNQDQSKQSTGFIELIRQKWIDSVRDHVVYSTEFVRKGLKFDDDYEDDNYVEGSDLSNMNHLLPIDTIKSFVQEARAHYSILERHAESLCNLVQSINTDNVAITSSFEANPTESPANFDGQSVVSSSTSVSTNTTGSRLFGLIRSRQTRVNSTTGDADAPNASTSRQGQATNITSSKMRNNSLTTEFKQDSWPCILFHLRLLMESTENTKTSMSQALTLMEHQEQLRQTRVQDQEERCRVLEDSLHALARDHHELEKSLSMSQIYHSVGCRSISMSISTDLNEYHDAFEDFDDEKTMTPTSLPSDEELDKKIQEVMDEEEFAAISQFNRQRAGYNKPGVQPSTSSSMPFLSERKPDDEMSLDEEDVDEDDLESNCSALTVETLTDQYMSVSDGQQLVGNHSQMAENSMISQSR